MSLILRGPQFRAMCAKLRVYLTEFDDHDDIAVEMGLSWADFEKLLEKYYAAEVESLREQSTERVYIDYVQNQRQNIADLTKLLGAFDETKQHSAMVNAVKARADILDKIIAKGQEFGFIDKKPEAKIVAGVVVDKLSTNELRSAITGELQHLDKLMTKFGGGEVPPIIDVEPGQIHKETPRTKVLEGPAMQKKRLPSNKVHKGRRVVKPKL